MSEHQYITPDEDSTARREAADWKEMIHRRKMNDETRAAMPTADESMVAEYIRKRIDPVTKKYQEPKRLPKSQE